MYTLKGLFVIAFANLEAGWSRTQRLHVKRERCSTKGSYSSSRRVSWVGGGMRVEVAVCEAELPG